MADEEKPAFTAADWRREQAKWEAIANDLAAGGLDYGFRSASHTTANHFASAARNLAKQAEG